MAKFIYGEGDRAYIELSAEAGEEISVEMVAAWAAVRQAAALEQIADNLIGIDNAINGLKPD